jgi:hypothetical protein
VELVSKSLQQHFLPIFDHLYQIRESKGVNPEEEYMEHSLFISISIIQDFHCNVHTDSNDFSYNFFVWFGANSTPSFITFFFIPFFSLFGSSLYRNNYQGPGCPLLLTRIEEVF